MKKQSEASRSKRQLEFGLSELATLEHSVPGIRAQRLADACDIVPVGKRRDGGTRYWCFAHKADATAKYGRPAPNCRYAYQPPVLSAEILPLDISEYPGGVALWGAVPPVYDTTYLPLDRGIHVHARRTNKGKKDIDATYRGVQIASPRCSPDKIEISELDAIYYMVTSVFGYETAYVECTFCGYAHLDKDWFSLHPHRRHLCAGCGKHFRDSKISIGNPIAGVREALACRSRLKPSKKKLNISQRDFRGGIQIWGSNPAILWTSSRHEQEGIHVHAFKAEGAEADPDETFGEVIVDGVALDPLMVRITMAQSALPHLGGRVKNVVCPRCTTPAFATAEEAFTPHTTHRCVDCRRDFPTVGRLRKVVANPFSAVAEQLASRALRPPRKHDLGLLPETI